MSDLGANVFSDEEPLFDENDLEDPPPLPPPMPSLSQLNQQLQEQPPRENSSQDRDINDIGANQRPPPAQDGNQKKRKPILTLTVDRIFSEKGLPSLETEFPKLKFKGKGHEVSDLNYLMQQYEHWANRLYPKLTFKDVLLRIERLSTTKEFKSRLGMIRRRHSQLATVTPSSQDHMDEHTPDPLTNHKENGSAPMAVDNPDLMDDLTDDPNPANDFSNGPDLDFPSRPDFTDGPDPADDLSNGLDLSDISDPSNDFPSRPDDLPNRPDDLPNRPDDLPNRPDDLPSRPDDLPSRPDDLPSRPDDLPNRPNPTDDWENSPNTNPNPNLTDNWENSPNRNPTDDWENQTRTKDGVMSERKLANGESYMEQEPTDDGSGEETLH